MARFMTPEKIRQMTQLFVHFDYNKNGTIHPQELYKIMRSMHLSISMEDVKQLLICVESNYKINDEIRLNQFLAIMSTLIQDNYINQQITEVFKIFDTYKKKYLQKQDLIQGFKQIQYEISENNIDKLLQLNQNRPLTFDDFCDLILKR